MAVPADNAYVDLVLTALGDGKPHSVVDLGREAAERFQSAPDASHDPMSSGNRTRHRYLSYMAVAHLFQAGLVERSPEGLFRITSHGRAVLAVAHQPIGHTAPEPIDTAKQSTPGKTVGPDTQPTTAASPTDMQQTGQDGQDGSDNPGSNRKRRPIRFPLIWTWVLIVLTVVLTVLKRRSIRILLIWTAISAALGGVCFWAGSDTTPTRPAFPDGGILVFVNRPDESADINVIVDNQGDFSISVNGNGATKFLVIASGSAAVEPLQNTAYDTGSPPDFTRGIRINSVGTPGGGIATWQQTHFQTNYHHLYQINGYVGDGDVMTAIGDQNPKNMFIFTGARSFVYGRLRNPIVASSKSGSAVVGQLPLIGAATSLTERNPVNPGPRPINGPITIAGHISFPHDITKWYAPAAQVHISLTSSPDAVSNPSQLNPLQPLLPPGYILNSAGPSTVNSNELLWDATGNVQVTWDLTNLSAARQASVWLFLSGILFGIAASFLGVLTDRLLEERGPNKESGQVAS